MIITANNIWKVIYFELEKASEQLKNSLVGIISLSAKTSV